RAPSAPSTASTPTGKPSAKRGDKVKTTADVMVGLLKRAWRSTGRPPGRGGLTARGGAIMRRPGCCRQRNGIRPARRGIGRRRGGGEGRTARKPTRGCGWACSKSHKYWWVKRSRRHELARAQVI